MLAFYFQLVRVSPFIVISERLIATMFLEKYAKISSNICVFFVQIIFTIIFTTGFVIPTVICKF